MPMNAPRSCRDVLVPGMEEGWGKGNVRLGMFVGGRNP